MTIEIQYVKMPNSESMNNYVTEKLERLAQKYEWLIRAQVHFKMEPDSGGEGKVCEIELSVPGPRLFAKSSSNDFEKSVNQTVQELDGQLRKKKTVMQRH
jgi:putative sigma-54 modulation protein